MIERALAGACAVGSDPCDGDLMRAHLLMGDADKQSCSLKPVA